MAPFVYQDFNDRFSGTIADLMARRGDAASTAALRRGQIEAEGYQRQGDIAARQQEDSGRIWGQAIQGVEQAVSGAITQATDPKRKIEQAQLDSLAADKAGRQALATAIKQFTTTDPETGKIKSDPQQIASFVAQAGFPDKAESWLKMSAGNAQALDTLQELSLKHQRAQMETAGDLAFHASSLNDFEAGIGLAAQYGLIPEPDARKMLDLADQAGPDGWKGIQAKFLPFSPSWKKQQDELSKPTKLGEGDKLVIPNAPAGTPPIAEGAPKPKNAAALAADAANPNSPTSTQSAAALALLKPRADKNPPSLEQQLLEAVANGDTEKRDQILTTQRLSSDSKRDPVATAQLEAIRNLSAQEARARLDDKDTSSPKNQAKFEQEYRTVLQRGMSSRSGGIGLEDAKVQQANHLLALMDQNRDVKTGEYNIPQVQYQELALGMAKLLSGTGAVGEGMKNDLVQATAAGDLKKVATYLTGKPFNGSTQDVFKMLRDSIERQGQVAQENREGEMRYLRGLAPTDLEETRRQSLEANSLNPLRQSRIAVDAKGNRKLFTSLDGGKTWQ